MREDRGPAHASRLPTAVDGSLDTPRAPAEAPDWRVGARLSKTAPQG